LVYELRAKGYRITLAHPERNGQLQRDDAAMRALVDQGVLLQLNAESLLGSNPSGLRGFARRLCQDGLVHVLASDGHRATAWRPVTQLAAAVGTAAELVGPERAQWMTRAVPAAILEGADLPEP